LELEAIIKGCRKRDRKMQKACYDTFSNKMFGVCKRYMKHKEDTEDALIKGFQKVFEKIEKFEGKGSFEGWIRRIMVNECLMMLRQNRNFNLVVEVNDWELPFHEEVSEKMNIKDILYFLNLLPTGYRTVFNLFVIEGYKHREIAEQLGISINTSKSQLILAKKRLKQIMINDGFQQVGS